MWRPDDYIERLVRETRPALAFPGKEGDWRQWRTALKARFAELLGGFPLTASDLNPVVLERVEYDAYIRERVEITTYEGLRMPIYVLIPKGSRRPVATVIACHGHGYGVRDIVGLEPDGEDRRGDPGLHRDFAVRLAERGHLVLAPEILGFGDRRLSEDADKPPRENSCYRLSTQLLLCGKTMAGHRIHETMRTIDYALTRPEADPQRIGCMGISGGGMVAAFTSALDERIRSSVVSGYANTFAASIVPRRHCLDNYIPGLLTAAEMPDLIGLIAPRPLLVEAGVRDHLFPIAAVQQAYARLQEIYAAAGAPDELDSDFFEGGHEIGGRKSFDWFSRV